MPRKQKIDIEKFHRPTTLAFITRIDKVLNLAAICRELQSCKHKNTFLSRINRHSDLTKDIEKRAFAEEVGEIFDEMWYIIGVGIGKIRRDPHKKFKYFYTDETDRKFKDKLEELEEKVEQKGKDDG